VKGALPATLREGRKKRAVVYLVQEKLPSRLEKGEREWRITPLTLRAHLGGRKKVGLAVGGEGLEKAEKEGMRPGWRRLRKKKETPHPVDAN